MGGKKMTEMPARPTIFLPPIFCLQFLFVYFVCFVVQNKYAQQQTDG
jgi:hypothetical protein